MADKVALITGASAGIGKARALALADAGFAVAVTARRQEALDAVVAEIEAAGGKAVAVTSDVGDAESVAALFRAVKERFGRLDVLFNNAGLSAHGGTIDEIDPADWQRVVDVNLTGTFLCAREAFALMKSQDPRGGRIINNGSISAHVPRPGSVPYTATKHGVSGITRQIALDGRPFDIACGQIDIGNAATEMTEGMTTGVPQADGSMAVEPRMDVHDVARSVVHMATMPLDANVLTMTVMATKMPYVGRG